MKFHADECMVKVIGRTLMREGTRYFNYPCSAVEFIFVGARIEATFWSDSYSLEEKYRAWVAVFVNDEIEPSKRFSFHNDEETIVLYEGEQVQETKIRLVKLSEAACGKVGIKCFTIDSDITPHPTQGKANKLEFIGDSITCGYGIEGRWNVDVFNTSQENPWKAYAATTARALDADYHLVAWSGIGIISSWTDQEEPLEGWLMPELYPFIDKSTDMTLGNTELELWDFKRFKPDCIIINLGTNDSSYTRNIPGRVKTFGTKYYDFINQVRKHNPQAQILCTIGTMGQDLYVEIEKQVKFLVQNGEDKIHTMLFDLQSEEDGIGADWHPSMITHKKMAIKLEEKLREIMNW